MMSAIRQFRVSVLIALGQVQQREMLHIGIHTALALGGRNPGLPEFLSL
jgi:hypothetical protein